MTRPALVLLAALAIPLASCDRAPTTARDTRTTGGAEVRRTGTPNASASGSVQFTFGSTTETLSFTVSNNASGVTTGTASFFSSFAGVSASINVTCLNVSGGTATFLGTVVSSSDASIVGDDAYWQVVDGSPDQSSLVGLAAQGDGPSCTSPGEFDLVDISSGSLTVS